MSTPTRTVNALGRAVEAELDDTYTVVYNGQGDELPADVVAALVRAANEWETTGGESLTEWESDARWVGACAVVDELATDIVRRWEREHGADHAQLPDVRWPDSDARTSAIHLVIERDDSAWFEELVNEHGGVLLRVRIPAMDEDAGLNYTPMTPATFLDLLGFQHTDHKPGPGWRGDWQRGTRVQRRDGSGADRRGVGQRRPPARQRHGRLTQPAYLAGQPVRRVRLVQRGTVAGDADRGPWRAPHRRGRRRILVAHSGRWHIADVLRGRHHGGGEPTHLLVGRPAPILRTVRTVRESGDEASC